MERILEYIDQKYNPVTVILYGSYANKTNDSSSDFDALVISSDCEQFHDTSFADGIQLDVFVYPASYFEKDYDCENFVQIFDGKIIKDSNDLGKNLKTNVLAYLNNRRAKTSTELQADIDWCVKMLGRAKRGDCEGMFRWHWVLTDSLEFFCNIMKYPYFGPKKTLGWMEKAYPEAFDCYKRALQELNIDRLEEWVAYIENAWEANRQNFA